jgi:Xaa-Pro dipeptidase
MPDMPVPDTTEIETAAADGRPLRLRFSATEHADRLARTRKILVARGLDALLVFAQESHYWLTGFDTSGYVFFQVGVITADARRTVLLTRRPDLAQARDASLYDDIRIWLNAEDANPAADLRDILIELGLHGSRVGIEYATYGLTAANHRAVEAALAGVVTLADASDIVRTLRLVKSPAELAYVREAARLADTAIEAMVDATAPGQLDSVVTAAGVAAMLAAGGDMPAGGPLVNSGPRAIYGRGIGGARRIEANDQMVIELGASCYRYHVCTEETIAIGTPRPRQRELFALATEAMAQVLDHARPGRALGELDDIHRHVLDRAGLARERFAACGYALGCTFRPTWMDVPPMIYSGNPLIMTQGMVFFVHIMVPDSISGVAAGLGRTFIITEGAAENLSAIPPQLHLR